VTRHRLRLDRAAVLDFKGRTQRVIKSLETYMKRANRRFVAINSQAEFKMLSQQWKTHLRWVRFHLAFFKDWPVFMPRLRQLDQMIIEELVSMAEEALQVNGYEVPDPPELRRVIRMFIRYSRRGRLVPDFRYMLNNRKAMYARYVLAEFVAQRLKLKEEESCKGNEENATT
jgi:hypothetical protein